MEQIKGTFIYSMKEEFSEGLSKAIHILKEGGLVAFPTETVYGLGANGLVESAVENIFKVKGRPNDNPLILHLHSPQKVFELVEEIPRAASLLMKTYWPGPLTLVLKKKDSIPDLVTGGLPTVALRVPASRVALALIEGASVPLAAPSANLSGRPSPTTAQHVLADLAGKIPLILDGGATGIGLESTVIDMTREPPLLLRPGGITLEELVSLLGSVEVEEGVHSTRPRELEKVSSPGMKYRHYAPKTPMLLIEGEGERAINLLLEKAKNARDKGQKVGILSPNEEASFFRENGFLVFEMGSREALEEVAHQLFSLLRVMDEANLQLIIAKGLEEKGIGLAIMNRLRRSASYWILKV